MPIWAFGTKPFSGSRPLWRTVDLKCIFGSTATGPQPPTCRHVGMPNIQKVGNTACRHSLMQYSRLPVRFSGEKMRTQNLAPVIALASTKGGVGKTTLAFCLATELAHRTSGMSGSRYVDCSVEVLDADPNQTLYHTIKRGNPSAVQVEATNAEGLLPALAQARQRASVVLIDLEGSANQAMLYACSKANLVLIPAQPSLFDVVEAMKTFAVVAQAADITGREILTRVVLSRTPVLKQRITAHSRKQFAERKLPLLTCELVERTAFRQMTFTGRSPAEDDPSSGAARNITALTDEVAALIGFPESRHTDIPTSRRSAGEQDYGVEEKAS